MQHIDYKDNQLLIENVPAKAIAAAHGTPVYTYSKAQLVANWQAYHQAFGNTPHQICFAVKACSNIAILNILAELGSGFDIVSGGELKRVITAGGDPSKTVFSGVGKTKSEIAYALTVGIGCINVESEAEIHQLASIANAMNKVAPVSVRVNPDIDAKTHPYISTGLKENKFGVDVKTAARIYQFANSSADIQIKGLDCHLGSQITELGPFNAALDKLLEITTELSKQGINIPDVNVGGGLGIRYQNEEIPSVAEYVSLIKQQLAPHFETILVEPGRSIVGDAGVLLTQVERLKLHEARQFVIVDAAMNDLLRPALYQGWHNIRPIELATEAKTHCSDIVGPVCESADFLGKDRLLATKEGDILAVFDTGAYGFSMSSNYNSRPRAAEILVDNDTMHLIRKRESLDDLILHEQLINQK